MQLGRGASNGMTEPDRRITRLLRAWGQGESSAGEQLLPLVYEHLQTIARNQFAGESAGHTLRPTALVHEAFLKLDAHEIDFSDRRHFFALAARTMRHILVDHARARNRAKRGGDRVRVTLQDASASIHGPDVDLLDLDDALTALEQENDRVARTIELVYFGGLSRDEASSQLEISPRTLDRDLRLGRAWLRAQLS